MTHHPHKFARCKMFLWVWVALMLVGSWSVEQTYADEPWEPSAVYLTWQKDPTRTITVHWLAWPDHPKSRVYFREVPEEGDPTADLETSWSIAFGHSIEMKASERMIHTVEITSLQPDTLYEFKPGKDAKTYRFRSLPSTMTRPIRFVAGGCIYQIKKPFEAIMEHMAERDPDFALLNGDIAYADGALRNVDRWHYFLETWTEKMVTSDGRLVPMIWAIGNHEVPNGGYNRPREEVPFFYDLIAFPKPGFGVLDFGDYLSIVILDSDHTNAINGPQKDWLDKILEPRSNYTHLFAAYHVPAYPSARRYDSRVSSRVRKHWVPLFEKHDVDLVFESHDHAFKRTHPILNGEIDAQGIVYVGDGGWATNGLRRPAAPGSSWTGGRWYLAKSAETHHAQLVTLDGEMRIIESIDATGKVFDEYRMIDGQDARIELTAGTSFSPPRWAWTGTILVLVLLGAAGYTALRKRQHETQQ